jgi:hypothetical protein
MQQAGTVTLLGRANTQTRPQNRQAAYQLRISNTGAWSIAKHTTDNTTTTLTSGTRTSLGLNTWHTITLGFSGSQITATLDGTALGTVIDGSYGSGQVGVGVVGYQTDMFDNVTITPNGGGGGGGGSTGVLRGQASGRCVDVPGATQNNSTQVTLYDCNGGTNQSWTTTPTHQLMVYGTKCLDVRTSGTTDGTPVQIYDCNGTGAQTWTLNTDGTITNTGSGKCLDATAHGTTNGTLLQIWTCNGGTNQKWTRT